MQSNDNMVINSEYYLINGKIEIDEKNVVIKCKSNSEANVVLTSILDNQEMKDKLDEQISYCDDMIKTGQKQNNLTDVAIYGIVKEMFLRVKMASADKTQKESTKE